MELCQRMADGRRIEILIVWVKVIIHASLVKKTCLKYDILVRREAPAQLYKEVSHNFYKEVSELLTDLHTFPYAPPPFLLFTANRKHSGEEQVIFKLRVSNLDQKWPYKGA